MFLSARDQLAAQQNEAIEGLRGDMLRIANENRQVQSQLVQVGSASVPSPSQTEALRMLVSQVTRQLYYSWRRVITGHSMMAVEVRHVVMH